MTWKDQLNHALMEFLVTRDQLPIKILDISDEIAGNWSWEPGWDDQDYNSMWEAPYHQVHIAYVGADGMSHKYIYTGGFSELIRQLTED